MVEVTRGLIVICDLNPIVGTEQGGVRPVIIVQINRANAVSPHTIIAPLTSKIRRKLLPSHVFIPAGIGGLNQDSVILCEQIRVIDKSRIISVIGHLDDNYIQELNQALLSILGLNQINLIDET